MKKFFFDMDGVITEYRNNCNTERLQEKFYFSTLKPEWNIVEAINLLLQEKEIEVYILTKVYPSIFTFSIKEKKMWIKEIMPHFPLSQLIMVNGEKEEKSQKIRDLGIKLDKDCILIDDYNPNLKEWQCSGGTAIKYVNGVNDCTKSFKGERLYYKMSAMDIYKKIKENENEKNNFI